jgi:glycosyltransferase involved in cell wall biosynthesis
MTPIAGNGLRLDDSAATLVAAHADAMAGLVAGLFEDRARRHRLGLDAYRLACRRHSWAACAARMSALLSGEAESG